VSNQRDPNQLTTTDWLFSEIVGFEIFYCYIQGMVHFSQVSGKNQTFQMAHTDFHASAMFVGLAKSSFILNPTI
jgi:hypothetical protein